jgi:hypothetical protein
MKKILFFGLLGLMLQACNFNAEVSQDPATAAEQNLAYLLDGDYQAIYDQASVEMKNHISETVFLDIAKVQEKLSGKFTSAKLLQETSGKYQNSVTQVYEYELTNEEGLKFNHTAEYLRGHLLKHFIEEPEWRAEPAFAKALVDPIKKFVQEEDATAIHAQLEGKYPVNQILSLLQQINRNTEGVEHHYVYHWTDNDANNDMMVTFVYGYQGKGYLEYRFFIKDGYPLAGIFFNPDANTQIP